MGKKYGSIGGYQPTSFFDRKEGKKPVLLYILPVLMILVVLGAVYLAYRDSTPPPASSTTPAVSSAAVAVRSKIK